MLVFQFALYLHMSNAEPVLQTENREVVYYFAYGSNMNDRYFTRVRGISRYSSAAATVAEYQVSFTIDGIAGIEPAFANLSPSPASVAYGVVHAVSPEDFAHIVESEGSSYKVVEVSCTLRDGSEVIALTLSAPGTLNPPLTPSRRYLTYLHEAAAQYEFPGHVIQSYDPKQGKYIPVISEIFGAAIHTMAWIFARV